MTAPIPSPAALKERALATEDAARAVAGVTNSEGAGASAGRTVIALATSHGFARGYSTSGYGGSASVIAGAGGGDAARLCQPQRPPFRRSRRARGDRPPAPASARSRGSIRASSPAATMPVVFDPRVGGSLIGHLIGAITGPAIARKHQLPARPARTSDLRRRRSPSSTIRTGRAACAPSRSTARACRPRRRARSTTGG